MAVMFGLAFVVSWMSPSFLRVVMTTAAVNLTFIPLVWFFVFDGAERRVVMEKIMLRLNIKWSCKA